MAAASSWDTILLFTALHSCCSLVPIHLTAAAALSLDLASKLVTALDCGIEDLLEVVEERLSVLSHVEA